MIRGHCSYLGVDEIVVITELRIIIRKVRHCHALPETLLLTEGDVLNAKLMPDIMIGDETTHITKVSVSTTSSSPHIVDLVAQIQVFLTLSGQLLAVVLVPSEDIGVGLF